MDWSRLYSGYISTPLLWKGSLNGLEQLELPQILHPKLTTPVSSNVRLGSLAEQFTFDYWSNIPNLVIAERNIQIQGQLSTLGELDAIIRFNQQWFHVEIAYKIYLYDPNHGKTPLEHWIGPNRKDTLLEKLERLQHHQLPLIHQPETIQILEKKSIPNHLLYSRTWVKGLLFTPENFTTAPSLLNKDCLAGSYLNLERFKFLKNARFFLPHKLEWMMEPHAHVKWKNHCEILPLVEDLHEKNYAPMLWMKQANGELTRLFVVWW